MPIIIILCLGTISNICITWMLLNSKNDTNNLI